MEFPIYQIDAFADKPFTGNPAAVIPLEHWLPDETLQSIAEENQLSETAFYIHSNGSYHIRWFTPTHEVDLCGHATLACAWLIFKSYRLQQEVVQFSSRSGILSVKQQGSELVLDFPAQPPQVCEISQALIEGLGAIPKTCLVAEDIIAVFPTQSEIEKITPNAYFLKKLSNRGVIITAPANEQNTDFVVRFFAPKLGIDEDPVTGSAFTQLAPYWSEILKKENLNAHQLSKRGGRVGLRQLNQRVLISGQARLYMQGFIRI
ncbi:PhzF family phenazine biosynthesis protein [Gayadomonas joobiniege]|uniref:PhzF family phenazine biosynthesis protein n=1 Tax=Gayadomonas joobiniege TaxID=1234606 RepID=UPI00037710EA|nr:PhzF family phenazine biosynthesis protein [Gayadomonas joobiniege]